MTEQKTESVQVLMKNNIITKAKFNMTTVQNRIFQLVMYKLQKSGVGVLESKITLEEFKKIVKYKEAQTPEGISEMLVELRKQSVYFKKTKEEQKRETTSKKQFSVWGEWGIINGHEYDEETETFTIEASEKVHSLLHEYLEGGYTPINLSVFFSLSNSYAQRFYDLLRLWSNKKKSITYTLAELRELLMLEEKYPRYVDFKRRVITPAIKELNNTGMFKVEVREYRKGKAVEKVEFLVEDFDKRKYFDSIVEPSPAKGEEVEPEEEVAVEQEEEVSETKIPAETVVLKPVHRLIKAHFKGIDFTKGEEYMAYVETEVATQLQDNVEQLGLQQWGYFKQTLQNKLEQLESERVESEKVQAPTTSIDRMLSLLEELD